jgi:hypothetical protein
MTAPALNAFVVAAPNNAAPAVVATAVASPVQAAHKIAAGGRVLMFFSFCSESAPIVPASAIS